MTVRGFTSADRQFRMRGVSPERVLSRLFPVPPLRWLPALNRAISVDGRAELHTTVGQRDQPKNGAPPGAARQSGGAPLVRGTIRHCLQDKPLRRVAGILRIVTNEAAAPSAGSKRVSRSRNKQRQRSRGQRQSDQQQDAIKQHRWHMPRDSYTAVSKLYRYLNFTGDGRKRRPRNVARGSDAT